MWRFLPLSLMQSTHFKFTKNCHMKHRTATFAKPLLGAGVSVHIAAFTNKNILFAFIMIN